ncbi:MAG: dihydrofolate reductase family protein, partial [Sulfitobacter sp.]
IMGRGTYEFGYRFGLEPGQNPYPHMQTYVVSQQLDLPQSSAVSQVTAGLWGLLSDLRRTAHAPLYLCGGGQLAGTLLQRGAIDLLRLKRAPILLRTGTPLFAGGTPALNLTCQHSEVFDGGYLYQEYKIRKPQTQ